MRRGLLLIVIVLVAVLAWPAMTPGLFSGEGLRDAWRMAAEATHNIAYSPRVRLVWGRVIAAPREIAALIPAEGQKFAEAAPAIRRQLRPVLADLSPIAVADDEWWFVMPHWRAEVVPYRHFRRRHHRPVIGAIPEPATWLLMIAGFGMVGLALRHRRPSARAD